MNPHRRSQHTPYKWEERGTLIPPHLRKNRDYSNHIFTSVEKQDICKFMNDNGWEASDIASYVVGLERGTVWSWNKKYKESRVLLDSTKSRPTLLDPIAQRDWKDFVDTRATDYSAGALGACTKFEIKENFKQQMNETSMRRFLYIIL